VSLTVDGFAPPRTGLLRGKGGTRQRGDNGVSPLPRAKLQTDSLSPLPRAEPQPEGIAKLPRAKPQPEGIAKLPRAKPQQNGLYALPRAKPQGLQRSRARPAALEWRDARLPLLGRLWATAWLPSILLAGCLVALMYLLQTSGVATTGYDIQRLQTERDDWQLRNEQLRLEVAKRRSLTWIESEATARLGMVRPEPTALTYLKVSH